MSTTIQQYLRVLLLCLFALFPAFAFALPTVNVGPFGPGTVDGSAPFNVLGACASASDTLIQGEDCGESNKVVRTQDVVAHIWSVTADNYTPGDPNLKNVVLEQTLTPSTNGVVDFEKLPIACTPVGGGGSTPASVIVKNADGSSIMTCNLGEFTEGQQKSITVNVKISGNSWNGSDYTSTQRVYSLGTDGNPNATEGTSPAVGPIKISAAPAFDLVHSITSTHGMYTNYIGSRDVGNGLEPGFYTYMLIRMAAARKTGIEALQQPLLIKDEIIAYANAENGPVYPVEMYITECRDNPSGWGPEVFGSKSYYPSYDDYSYRYHALNSGTCTYTRDNAADPTSGVFTVSLDNADFAGTHYPTRTFANADLSAGPYYAMSHRVQFWIPFRSIDMVDGQLDNSGTVYLKSTLSDFDPNGISGVSNYAGDTEPGYNGAPMDGLRGNNVIGGSLTLTPRGYFRKDNLKTVDVSGTSYTPIMDGTYVWSHNGFSEREPGEAFVSFVIYENNGTLAFDNAMTCDVFDNTTLKLTDASRTGGTAGQYSYIGTYAIGGFDNKNYQTEYAALNLSGDDPLDANHDGTLDYDIGTGRYQGDWTKARTTRCDDSAPAGGWFTDPNAVPGGIDAVNAVRVRITDAAKTAGIKFEPSHQIRHMIPLEARDKFNGGPHNGKSIPVGTVMPNFAGVRADQWANNWTDRNYLASPENGSVDGDRVTMSRLNIILDSYTVTPSTLSGNTASILAGGQIVWKVDTAVQSTQANPSSADNLQIIDVIPPTATYNAACTAAQVGATPPSLIQYNTDKDGNPAPGYTRLLWNFGDVVANTRIPPRIFCTDTDPLAAHGTAVVNYAEIRADNVITALEVRSDDHTITLEQTGSIQVAKKVDMPLDDQNDDQVYTLSWSNFAPSFAINAPTVIDVFSFTSGTGDGDSRDTNGNYISLSPRSPASNFHGKFTLTGAPVATWLDGSVPGGADPFPTIGTWSYTADAPSSVNYDPDNNTSKWCLESEFGTADCPANFAAVTAIRFVSNYELAKDGNPRQGVKATYSMQAGDAVNPLSADVNKPGNIYTNRFTFDSSSLPASQFLRSNNVSVQVAAFSIGDLLFADVDGNGKYDAGIDGVAPDGVKVELYNATNDGKVADTTTGGTLGAGRYLFGLLPSGSYYVRIPATEFQPGGKLYQWNIAPPTGVGKENDDQNEQSDQHGYTESTVDATGVRTGTIVLSANPPPPGGIPTGNEPTGDNVLPIADTTGDDFSNLTLDIGLKSPLSSIGNIVWVDSNNNGLQDVSELGLSNVTVNLLSSTGTVLQTLRTDNNGYYNFSGLTAGTYTVEVIKPEGYAFSPADAGADDTADSDTAAANGRTAPITLAFGQHDSQWDSGLYKLGSIGDRVWIDSNANGQQDSTETAGIAGVTVKLLDAGGAVLGTTETDANGNYLFSNLTPGNYTVDVDQADAQLAGYSLTSANDPQAVTLAAGENYRNADFGYVNYASVGNTVWHDLNGNGVQDAGEPGIAGVTVRLLSADGNSILRTVTTDSNGNYLFATVVPGDYVVEVVKPADYTGFVIHDQNGNDALDSDVLVATGRTSLFSLSAGQNRTDVDAGLYQSAALGNLLWLDANGNNRQDPNEPGLAGTPVTLTGTLGTGVAFTSVSAVTDANGQYQFTGLYPGSYTVTFTDTGFVTADQGGDDTLDSDVTPTGVATVTLPSGTNNQTLDAGIASASVTGRVWIDNNTQNHVDNGTTAEQGVVGVTINLIEAATGNTVATTTTGVEGVYNFTGLKPDSYLIEVIEPADMGFVKQDQGGDNSTDSDVNIASGRSEPFTLAAGQHVTDLDAGIEPGSLGDRVSLDLNNNGIQDAGEPGVAGIVVTLKDGAGNTVATQTTDTTGFYNFINIVPGAYTVHFELPGNMQWAAQNTGTDDTVDFDADTNGNASVTVVSGVGNQTIDAGIIPATLGDTVWFDQNGDGIQDANEPGVADIVVTLLGKDGNPMKDAGGNPVTTTTDSKGNYQFIVLPGDYAVRFTAPTGLGFTAADKGSDDGKDADTDADGLTPTITLASGDTNNTVDAGIAPALISGTVLHDVQGNGTQEATDTALTSVTLTLRGTDVFGNAVELTTMTDTNGYYQFNVLPGTYTVQESNPVGLTSSGAETGTVGSTPVDKDTLAITVKSNETSANNDFLDFRPASLSGQVRLDTDGNGNLADTDTGIAGVEIMLWRDTNADGIADGVYANTSTNTAGEYSFLDLPPGHYVVIESDPLNHVSTADTFTTNDNRIAVALDSGETSPGHDFLDTLPANISGQVRLDEDRDADLGDTEKGIAGVTLTLYTDPNGDGDPADGSVVTTTTTDAQGNYLFSNVLPNTYVVVESDPDNLQSTADKAAANDNRVPVVLLANSTNTGNDFLDTSILGSLGGVVWADADADGVRDAGEAGIANATVVVKGVAGNVIATLTTDANGAYQQANLPAGAYRVEVQPATLPAGSLQTGDPDSSTDHQTLASVVSGQHTGLLDFGYASPASIGDTVWHDLNANGIQEAGEPGIANVPVKLLSSSQTMLATTTTDANGQYRFGGLLPGSYAVVFAKPAPYLGYSPANQGSDTAADSEAVTATGETTAIALSAGQQRTDIDVGLFQPASLGDTVWFDSNGNGLQEAGEPGMAGVTITLTGTPADGSSFAPQTTTTDAAGHYLFSNLVPGNYSVDASLPAGMAFTRADQGADDTADSDVAADGTASTLLASGEVDTSLDAGVLPAAVTGRVWVDNQTQDALDNGTATESGVVGVHVNLVDASTGHAVLSTTTGTDGTYTFTGVMPGQYRVEVVEPAHMGFVSQDQGTDDTIDSDVDTTSGRSASFPVISGETVTDVDAGIQPGGLGDRVWLDSNTNGLQDSGEPGVAGIVVKLLDANGQTVATQTTDATGFYNFTGVLPAAYSVAFELPAGMKWTEQNQGTDGTLDSDVNVATGKASVTVLSGVSDQTVDAGILPATLGDTVWFDRDGNGLQDAGEPALPGITVQLLDATGTTFKDVAGNPVTTITDANGHYHFTVLPGAYGVQVLLPAGVGLTQADAGDEAQDSDTDPATGKSAAITVASGDNITHLDAGIQPATLSGSVIIDRNADGSEGTDDTTHVAGVTLTVTGTDSFGNPVTATTITDADGNYTVQLPPGSYTVTETQPVGYTSTGAEAGTGGSSVVNADTLTVTLESGETSAHNDFLESQPAKLSGQVRLDTDGDGDLTDTDTGISGVQVYLWADSNGDGLPDSVLAGTTTDTNGQYEFNGLNPGHYVVVEGDPALHVSTADTQGANNNQIAVTLQSGETSPGHDFIDTLVSGISGQVRFDADRDGDLNDTETGIPAITITLYTDPNGDGDPADGVVVATTTTNTQGNYQFNGIVPGSYTVVETDGEDTQSTADKAAANDNRVPVVLLANSTNTGNDFLDTSILGSLGGVVWADADADGVRDAGEAGIANATVVVKGVAGNVIATLTTDANGAYQQANLPAGAYRVEVQPATLPAGSLQTGDPDSSTDHQTLASVVSGQHTGLLDFGYASPASIGDTVWHDLNANGIQEAGEPGIANVPVKLLSSSQTMLATTTTDANGQYRFGGLLPGSYAVVFAKPAPYLGYSPANQGSDTAADSEAVTATGETTAIALSAGQQRTDIDVGLFQPASLGDTVWFDSNGNGLQEAGEPGMAGVTITLTGTPADGSSFAPQTTTTDAAGHYLFSNLVPGNYSVDASLPAGMAFTRADQGADDTADSDVAADGTASTLLASGEVDTSLDAGVLPAAVTGRVWVDNQTQDALDNGTATESGVVGVHVNLVDASTGHAVLSTTTGTDGTYTFTGVMPGQYRVEVVEPAHMGFVSQDQGTDDTIDSDVDTTSGRSASFPVISGETVTDVDAGIQPGGLGDRVWLDSNTNGLQDSGEPGVAGIVVKLLDANGQTVATQTTDATGFYNFTGVLPAAYSVAFELPAGMKWTEQNQGTDGTLDSDVNVATGKASVTVLSGVSDQTVDAGILPATLGDTVWFDRDGNGLQDAGEPALPGITVQLLDATGTTFKDVAGNPVTTITDANGHYHFTVLPGAYGVQVLLPAGVGLTQADAGDEAQDSDTDPATGKSAAITVASGDNITHLDAGIQPATLSGSVIIDRNADGSEGTDDTTHVAGVTLTVTGTDSFGNPVTATTITDADGNYTVQLPPGSYTVTETQPVGYTSTGAEAGTGGSSVVNADTLTVTLESGETSAHNDFLESQPAKLSGQVRLDTDGDGDLTDTDTGISGVQVYLWADSNGDGLPDSVLAGTTTDTNGQYEFNGLNPGHYVVVETDPAAHSSTADTAATNDNRIPVILASGESSPGHDFIDTNPANISGQVRLDEDRDADLGDTEKGIAGVTITLYTDPNGDGDPADGSVVTTTTTDAQGNYHFAGVLPGNYVVLEKDPALHDPTADSNGANDNRIPVTLLANTSNSGNDFLDAVQLGSLSGTVWSDRTPDGTRTATETGLANVTVWVKDALGTTVATLTTDANGFYQADKLPVGTYTVLVNSSTLPAGSIQTADPDGTLNHKTTAQVQAAQNTGDLDFGYVVAAQIGDTVWEDLNANGLQEVGEPGIAGVTVTLSQQGTTLHSVTTDSNGRYQFGQLPPGDYTVSFSLPVAYHLSTADMGTDDAVDSDPATDGKITVTLASVDNISIDAGFYRFGSLGDTVWLDANSNGLQDATEPAISGLTVNLLDQDGLPVLNATGQAITAVTDANGHYLFTNLIPGEYRVAFVAPAGISFTLADQGSNDALDSDAQANGQAPATVISGQTTQTVDAGILPASVTGRVWIDNKAANGLDDGNTTEGGVIGVTVNLLDSAGKAVATTTTGADGIYSFTGLEPGDYQVEVIEPAHTGFIAPDQGSDDTKDSDVVAATGRSPVFTLTSGQTVSDVDAGIEPGALGDHVFLDLNRNGLQDSGEPGVAQVGVQLIDAAGKVVDTQTTDASGFYNFAANLPGDYSVVFTLPEGMDFTLPNVGTDDTLDSDVQVADGKASVTVISGVSNQTVDAGVVPAKLGDTVWLDKDGDGTQGGTEPVLAHVVVTLLDSAGQPVLDAGGNPVTTQTDASGKYSFTVLPGSYGVRIELPTGATFTQAKAGSNGSADSDADTITGKIAPVTLVSGQTDDTLDAGVKPATLSGTVLLDANGNAAEDSGDTPLNGVTLTVSGTDVFGNLVLVTLTTDASGHYSTLLPPGTYTVTETNPVAYTSSVAEPGTVGSSVVNKDVLGVVLQSGDTSTGNDFLDYQPASISGQVREDANADGNTTVTADPAIAGVQVILWRDNNADGTPDSVFANTTTDANGNYSFTALPPGDYVVVETNPAGYISTADTDKANDDRIGVALVSAANSTGNDFLDAQPTASLGDRVWHDLNANGVQDTDELGVAHVTVLLYPDSNKDGQPDAGMLMSTTTDTNGNYLFSNLQAGSYLVKVTLPNGYERFSVANAGADDGLDSDVNAEGLSGTVTLSGNQTTTSLDAGIHALASVGNMVWLDRNNNALQDNGEPGIAGITVKLTGTDGTGQPVSISTTTDQNGTYQFADLIPGNYNLAYGLPTGMQLVAAHSGSNGVMDSDPATDSKTATETLTSGEQNPHIDAGVQPASLSGVLWEDRDGDGVRDEGEAILPAITVTLYTDPNGDGNPADGEPVMTSATNTNGEYLFNGLLPATYVVTLTVPDPYRPVASKQGDDRQTDSDANAQSMIPVTLPSGMTTHQDAGFERKGSFGDRIWLDLDGNGLQDVNEPVIRDVMLALLDKDGNPFPNPATGEAYQTTTNALGEYQFTLLWPGSYQVQILTLDGFTLTQTDAGSSDALDNDANAKGRMPAFVYSGEHNATVDAGILPASVSGRVWFDNQTHNGVDDNMHAEPGAVGIVVNLLDKQGTVVATTTTGVDGLYSFAGILPGDYQVEFVTPEHMKLVQPDQGGNDATDSDAALANGRTPTFTLTSTQSAKDLDAGIEPGALGDRVWVDLNQNGVQDTGEPGVAGITVKLNGSDGKTYTTTTDSTGFYVFNDLVPGDYTVGFVLPEGMKLIAANQGDNDAVDSDPDPVTGLASLTVTSGAAGNQSIDAGIMPARIGNTVWLDSNANGLQEDGEPGIAQATVMLMTAEGALVQTMQTDAAGHYQFSVLPGQYVVGVLPQDSSFTEANLGNDDQRDSDVNSQGSTPALTFTSGTDDQSIDIGILPALISGRVVNDLGMDGLDGTDTAITEVTVTVKGTDSYGNPVTVITKTDGKGEYQAVLPPGKYTVTESEPTDFLSCGSLPGTTPDSTSVDHNQVYVPLVSGWIAENVSFLDYQPASITGKVVYDPDGNGDTKETGTALSGVLVTLYTDPNGDGNPADGKIVGTVTTGKDGVYSFTDLDPGKYVLLETDPAGKLSTGDTASTNDNLIPLALLSGQDHTDSLFLDTTPVTLVGTVREDANVNGLLDDKDPGIPGTSVNLYTDPNGDGDPADGKLIASTQTDGAGQFNFTGLLPGAYVVVETDPAGYDSLTDSKGNNDNRIPVVLVADVKPEPLTFVDTHPVGDLTGYVFNDSDGDGNLADPDSGIPGVTVALWTDPNGDGDPADGKQTSNTVTDANGHYEFPDVPAGHWVVLQHNKPAFVSTADASGNNDERIPVEVAIVTGTYQCKVNGKLGSCTGLSFLDRPLRGELDLLKTAYAGHDGGAKCGTEAAKTSLTLVDIEKDLQDPVTYCFEISNAGETYLVDIELQDDLLGITHKDMQALTAIPARLPPLSQDKTARIRYYYESVVTQSLVNTASASSHLAMADGTPLEGTVNAADTSSVEVNFVFDPPSAFKTVKATGENVMQWQMVWINSGMNAVAGVEVYDEVPVGTSYSAMTAGGFVSPDGVYCEARGKSTTTTCRFETPSKTYPRGRVVWKGQIGADLGHKTEAQAANEVVIRFYSTLDDKTKAQTIDNRAHSAWDMDNDGKTDSTVSTDNGDTAEPGDSTKITFGTAGDSLQIPTLSEWALWLLGMFMLLLAGSRLRRRL